RRRLSPIHAFLRRPPRHHSWSAASVRLRTTPHPRSPCDPVRQLSPPPPSPASAWSSRPLRSAPRCVHLQTTAPRRPPARTTTRLRPNSSAGTVCPIVDRENPVADDGSSTPADRDSLTETRKGSRTACASGSDPESATLADMSFPRRCCHRTPCSI